MDDTENATSGKQLVERVRARFKVMSEADDENRRKALDDLRFLHVPGEQWDAVLKAERGPTRACPEYNVTRVKVKRVVNDIRANRPQGKVRAIEDNDKDTAEVFEGLCRNIWNCSDGDTIIDAAAEFQVGCGMGAWRVNTKYATEEAFDQDIVIEAIRNPFCLYSDPAAQDFLKRDAEDWLLTEKITKKAFEARYPKAKRVDFETDDTDEDWEDDDRTRIAEYWWKEPYTKELWLLSDGSTVDSSEVIPEIGRTITEADLASRGLQITRKRLVKCERIKMAIVSGAAVLEGPTDWAGSEFPFIQIYGENVIIDGKTHWFGLTRFAKDAQRSLNLAKASISESVHATSQSKYFATPEQMKGHEQAWAEAHKKNFPFQLYNHDPLAPGPPQRMGAADVPAALIEIERTASDDIKAVTGIFDASLGAKSNEQSGIAIQRRQAQGEIATYNYSDNVAKGIRRTWEILVGLIPKVYDTERAMRILGADGAEKYVKVNSVGPDGMPLNDVTRGKYDVTVTTGPGHATQRLESQEFWSTLLQGQPELFAYLGDLALKSSDVLYADQAAKRVQAMAPPQIQALEKPGPDGKPVPPQVTQALMQADQAMQQAQAMATAVQESAQQVQADAAKAEKAKADIGVQSANLKAQEAQLAQRVAEFKALVAETNAQFAIEQAKAVETEGTKEVANDREALSTQVKNALVELQGQSQEFMQKALELVTQALAQGQPVVHVPPKPKIVSIEMQRENGRTVAVPRYEEPVLQ